MFTATAALAIAAPAWADKAAGAPEGSSCNTGHWYGNSYLRDGKWVCLTTLMVNPNQNKGSAVNPSLAKGSQAKATVGKGADVKVDQVDSKNNPMP